MQWVLCKVNEIPFGRHLLCTWLIASYYDETQKNEIYLLTEYTEVIYEIFILSMKYIYTELIHEMCIIKAIFKILIHISQITGKLYVKYAWNVIYESWVTLLWSCYVIWNVISVASVGKTPLWLYLWHWFGWLSGYVLSTKPDEHDRSVYWLHCECVGVLSTAYGYSVIFVSFTLITVSMVLFCYIRASQQQPASVAQGFSIVKTCISRVTASLLSCYVFLWVKSMLKVRHRTLKLEPIRPVAWAPFLGEGGQGPPTMRQEVASDWCIMHQSFVVPAPTVFSSF